jgi:ribokinase
LDYISPNETELARLDPTINLDDIVNEVRTKLISKYPNLKVLLKEGSHGSSLISKDLNVKCYASSNEDVLKEFKIVDTVGAGDCFTGSFAVKHS